MVTVCQCLNIDQAKIKKLILEAAGIPAWIPQEHTATLAPHFFLTDSGGVHVQVPEAFVSRAQAILEASD
jgi:hypothetical protein